MKLEKKKHNEYKARFYWGDDKKNMWIELAIIPQEDMDAFRKSCISTIIDFPKDPETGRMQRVETPKFDEKKFMELVLEKSIISWGNFDLEGEQLECTLENKKMLVNDVDGFGDFYAKAIKTLMEDHKKKFGGTSKRKNS